MSFESCATDLNTWSAILGCAGEGVFQNEMIIAGIVIFIVVGTLLARTRMPAEVIFASGIGIIFALVWLVGDAFIAVMYLALVLLGILVVLALLRYAKK
jgi:hypothetical protein